MSEQTINWIDPKKEGHPKKFGNYLVTIEYEMFRDNVPQIERRVDVKWFRPAGYTWFPNRINKKDRWYGVQGANVTAWAEFPDPFNPIKLLEHQTSDSAS